MKRHIRHALALIFLILAIVVLFPAMALVLVTLAVVFLLPVLVGGSV